MPSASAVGTGTGLEADAVTFRTVDDPYMRASIKRSVVKLYDTCHRLLSFKVCHLPA